MENLEIRKAISEKKLKHYRVAQALGISPFTFSHWLQLELPAEKKKHVLNVISKMDHEKNH